MPPERLLVVTTRSRLRSVRFLPGMLLATRRIRRQLAGTEGIVRWASVITGPTEFWTITVWRSRHAMQEFMRSGEHGRIMWQVGRWLASFWLLRSRPGPREVNAWDGLALRRDEPAGADAPAEAESLVLDTVLAGIPQLRGAIGAGGAAAYDSSPLVRRARERVAGAGGVLVRVSVPVRSTLPALVALHRLARALRAEPDALRAVVGLGRPGEVCLLALWRDREGAERLLDGGWMRAARTRWGERLWAGEWLPESEFGTWDGLRLRSLRRRPPDR